MTSQNDADFASEWREICASIRALEKLDTGWYVHQAETHEYSFHPCLTKAELESQERQLGVRFPPELIYVYTQVGDGGVGPDWGLQRVEEFSVACANDDADTYVSGLAGSDLLHLAQRYYDWPMFLVCSGPMTGSVVSCYDGEYRHLGRSIAQVYKAWLRREHLRFGACQRLIELSDDIEEIWRRRDEILTPEMEDECAPGAYSDQMWLTLYIGSMCDPDPEIGWTMVELQPHGLYVQRPETKRAFAEMVRAYRERIRNG